jgi:dolichol-phosphate mannosyltransferase
MPSKEKLVIIPTYNERENIERMLARVMELEGDFNVLIIDDASPDGTAERVKTSQQKYVGRISLIERSGKLGLGTAYICGFKWALANGYEYIFEMDADFSHNPDDLVNLYKACRDGADIAIGSRYINGVNVVNWPIGRVIMSYMASKYVRLVTGMRIMDATAGFICYRGEVLKAINLDNIKLVGYGFQIEMKFTAWKLGFKIVEVPIIFTDRKFGVSKMSGGIFNEALWGVIAMKLKSLFKPYEKLKVTD